MQQQIPPVPDPRMSEGSQNATTHRLAGIEAIRGVAALAVVLYHFPAALQDLLGFSAPIAAVFRNGNLGVDAFFILSGFVIALSLRSGPWTGRYFGRFVLRRSIRLDPPYWFAIALEVFLGWLGVRFFGDPSYDFPNAADLGAHLFYLQGLLGRMQVSDVFWTLCFEIQFYLALVGLVVLAHTRAVSVLISPRPLLGTVLVLVTALSLAVRNGWMTSPNDGLAIIRAYQFAMGVTMFLLATQRISWPAAMALIVPIIGIRLLDGAVAEVLVMIAAAGACYAALRSPRFNRATDGRVLQLLGRISYSLYLYHASIVWRVATVALKLVPRYGIGMAWLGLVGGIGGSIAFAWVLNRVLETPMMQVSRRVKLSP